MDNEHTSEPPASEPQHARNAEAEAHLAQGTSPDNYDEVMRANRKKLALIGLATGGVMSLIVLLCLLLAYLLSTQ